MCENIIFLKQIYDISGRLIKAEPKFGKILDSKKVSIKDIASKSGVSIGTVDRVIHQRGEVSEKTRKKVLKVIEALNYQPNLIARSLASKKKLRLAILLPSANSENEYWHFPQIGIKKALNEIHDHGPVVHQLSFDQGNRKEFLEQLKKLESLDYDGLLTAAIFPDDLSEYIASHRKSKSIILVDSNIPDSGIDFVGQDAIKSGHVAGRLIELLTATYEQSKVLIPKLVSNPQSMPILLKRIEGFKQYFQNLERQPVFHEVTYTIKPHQKSIPELRKALNQGYQAVFVPNSRSYLVSENTTKKLSIIGYDLIDQNVKLLIEGGIDFVISQQPERQGYMAVMRLFNKLIGKTNSTMQYHLPIDILMKENVENYINKQMEFKSDIGY
tara:strand:- start:727 stop:1881 length:1155 start_codon:yes stop_codon:yes gene_type:complete